MGVGRGSIKSVSASLSASLSAMSKGEEFREVNKPTNLYPNRGLLIHGPINGAHPSGCIDWEHPCHLWALFTRHGHGRCTR